MKNKRVRVRFAPSPTGPLHMGGVRTALYNYLFAKKNNGDFLLRIEDTDRSRYVEGSEKYIIDSLRWCGISPDEGVGVNNSITESGPHSPYRQSKRKDIYRPYVEKLIKSGHAYMAFDTPEELSEIRDKSKKAGNPNWQYNSITRTSMKNSLTLSAEDVNNKLLSKTPYVVRVKMPHGVEIKFHDEIRGWVSVNSVNVDDKVLMKGDGLPTYHLANVVDDHLMEISHVIRGEEWLPSAPLHVILYDYFQWERPIFAHLPLLLRPDGNGKLSKRDGDKLGFPVFPLNWSHPETKETASGYKEFGFYPEGFVNMLAFLGWNPGTNQEIFSLEELVSSFSLQKVSKAGARFDYDKARWFNQQQLRIRDESLLIDEFVNSIKLKYDISIQNEWAKKVLYLFMDRAEFMNQIVTDCYYLFEDPVDYDSKMVEKKWSPNAQLWLKDLTHIFSKTSYNSDEIEASFKNYLNSNSLNFSELGPVLRLAIAGKTQGPSIFTVMELIGKDISEIRINNAITILN